MCDSFHGYANRETWALQLWLSNDQGLYGAAREYAVGGDEHTAANLIESWIEDLWWEIADSHDGLNMVYDVGSLWRVDWNEVARALRD